MARDPDNLEKYAWRNADVGIVCRACNGVTVYCAWDVARCFRERGWTMDVEVALQYFRCACGCRDVAFRPIPIDRRPRPLRPRHEALRPIYREAGRSLLRRGPAPFPDPAAIEAALALLARTIHQRRYEKVEPDYDAIAAALELLRPFVYQARSLDEFTAELRRYDEIGAQPDVALTGILRQLGQPR